MKASLALVGAALAICTAFFLTSTPTVAQTTNQLDGPGLKKMLEGLGYPTKDLATEVGKEKYEIKATTTGFDVPMGAEISPSKNFVWLTVFLGKAKSSTTGSIQMFRDLLLENGKIQPVFFYITEKENLMLAIAIENNSINPAQLKARIEKLAGDVGKTNQKWKDVIGG